MSQKAFYQTFYQTESLFRLPNDPLVFGGRPVVVDEPVARLPVVSPVVIPVVVLPVVPVEPVVAALPVVPVVVETIAQPILKEALAEPVVMPTVPVPVLTHRVLIVVDAPLPGEVLFLKNVLKAIDLTAEKVDLLTLPDWQGKNFHPVLATKQVDQFILFGVSFAQLGLDIEMDAYHPVRFDGITFMQADAPGLIETDRTLKKRLWESLKRIFLRA